MTDFEIKTWIKIIQADQEAQRQGYLSAFWSPEDNEEKEEEEN